MYRSDSCDDEKLGEELFFLREGEGVQGEGLIVPFFQNRQKVNRSDGLALKYHEEKQSPEIHFN